MLQYLSVVGQGYDTHAIISKIPWVGKPLVLAGKEITADFCCKANSDGDVIYHALANAISSFTGVNILGKKADTMCRDGITNSAEYVKEALKHMPEGSKPLHVAVVVEAKIPKLAPHIEDMKLNIAKLMGIDVSCVGITATTGEGLTAFGKGEGIAVWVTATFAKLFNL